MNGNDRAIIEPLEQALAAADIPSDDALMWLGAFVILRDGDWFPPDTAAMTEYAATCHRLGLTADEGIRWFHVGASADALDDYLDCERNPTDLRRIRGAVREEARGSRKRRLDAVEVHKWMLSKAPTALLVWCIRAGLKSTEVDSLLASDEEPLAALQMLAVFRGYVVLDQGPLPLAEDRWPSNATARRLRTRPHREFTVVDEAFRLPSASANCRNPSPNV